MLHRPFLKIVSIFIIFFTCFGCVPESENLPAPDSITVQLKWVHQAQFAGFYAAVEKGFYAAENLDVTLVPGGVGINIIDEVLSGNADFGLVGAEHVILSRSAGKPVKAIATTYRNNPFVLVTMPGSGIVSPLDFKGKIINIGGTDGEVQFKALLTKIGLSESDVEIIPYSYDLEPFYRGEVDITSAFSAGSLIGIQKSHPDVNVIWPIDYGIHFYSDTLFTTDSLIENNSDLVLRFLRATIKGHLYAIEQPEETLEICLRYAEDPDPEVQRIMLERSIQLIYTGQDDIGWMRAEVWQDMHDNLYQQGLLNSRVEIDQIYTIKYLEKIYKDAP